MATSAPVAMPEPTVTTVAPAPTTDEPLNLSLDTGSIATGFQTEMVGAVSASDNTPYWEVLPAYTRITLQSYPISNHLMQPQIFIYPVEELTAVNEGAGAIVASLQALLQLPQEIPNMPFLPLFNASQVMHAHLQYLDFQNGRGLRYLTQFAQGIVPINNYELIYTFQGLTADGTTYVAAHFPVTLPDLPASPQIGDEALAAMMADWQGYLGQTAVLLNTQPTAAFTPDLSALDALISSLSAGETAGVSTLKTIWPNDDESVDRQPVLQWEPFSAASDYHIVVLEDTANPPQIVIDQTSTEPMLALETALAPGRYSWTVRAQDGERVVLAEVTSTFSVKDVVELVAPTAGETVDGEPLLCWQSFPGAVNYQVVVVDDDAYPPVVALDQPTTETSLAVTPPLKAGSYSWTVWAYDSSGKLLAELNSNFAVAGD